MRNLSLLAQRGLNWAKAEVDWEINRDLIILILFGVIMFVLLIIGMFTGELY